ncbi:type II toxin-antitoxin system VapC family toxin [Methylocapsa sp. S129]|uniref:type II toxin-antitoxin system VapC family toxin n=1 Tax=Methylocapsa sp. S129 TaxID=1641869 RepID=UPI00131C6562|nr:type II toxin-antitoxin system VapC family toxin [Methylocapsa sp. S129]
MRGVLLDTHAWAWSMLGDKSLSEKAQAAIHSAETVFVSPISFFEIAQKARIGKWPQIEPLIERLPDILRRQGGSVASLGPEIALNAGAMPWSHRDPFDRFLAATAMHYGLPLVSADTIFDGLIARIW